ncbi:MAG: 4Fe-4S binding protein [Chloroflexi bacterium]|nr:4Fe-4S binding protein [Chloroflexota bacterium]
MHRETTRALYEMFPSEDKNDFFPAYLYLRYIDHFMYHVYQGLGLNPKELPTKLDEGTEEMMKAYVQQISELAPSADTNIYHGKVVKLKDAIQLVTQRENLTIDTPEQVVPFKAAKDIILRNPDSIAIGTCVCRAVSETPCLPPPQEVCLIVGDPFASFMADQNPKFRRSSQEEAVKIIEEAHKRGDVHCAYFKKDLGRRFFAICNCCDCCCIGVKMWNLLEGAVPFLAPSGYVAEVSDDCNGCGSCAENTCRFHAISMDDGAQKAVISFEKCMGCGVCEDVCPIGAISLRREPSKGDPLDIEALKT